MKNFIIVLLGIFLITMGGCNKKEETATDKPKDVNQTTQQNQTTPPTDQTKQAGEQNKNTKPDSSNIVNKELGEITLNLIKLADPNPNKIYNTEPKTRATIELNNNLTKNIDKYWIEARIKDDNGEDLADIQRFMFENVKKKGKAKYFAVWDNVKTTAVKEMVLTVKLLEVEGENLKNAEGYTKILDNKFNIKIQFEKKKN
jgi:hypothetical protein